MTANTAIVGFIVLADEGLEHIEAGAQIIDMWSPSA
jgi:hypothetical protein